MNSLLEDLDEALQDRLEKTGMAGWIEPLRYTTHRNTEGEKFYEEACDKGWEGVIAKEADSTYGHARSRHWLKFKCVN